jgi:hypothetical protein
MEPESIFLDKNNFSKLKQLLNELGMLPYNWLLEKSIEAMVVNFPTSGIGPLNKFFDKFKTLLKVGRLRISTGMLPLSLLLDKSM